MLLLLFATIIDFILIVDINYTLQKADLYFLLKSSIGIRLIVLDCINLPVSAAVVVGAAIVVVEILLLLLLLFATSKDFISFFYIFSASAYRSLL